MPEAVSDTPKSPKSAVRPRGGPSRGKMDKRPSGPKGGRPAYVPSKKDRELVEGMVLAGLPQDRIAEVMAITPVTLRKHFASVLDTGVDKTSGKVVRNLVALSKTNVAASAMFLYNRQPKYWQDRRRIDIKIEDHRPDLSHLTEDDLAQIEAAAQLLEAPTIEGTAIEVDETPAEAEGVPAAK